MKTTKKTSKPIVLRIIFGSEAARDYFDEGAKAAAKAVGDRVIYRPDWGHGSPKVAIVTAIELCQTRREKYGKTVQTIPSEKIEYGNFTFDNGSWAYGDQILCKCQFPIVKETSLKERLEEKLDVLPTCMDYKSLLDHVRSLTNLKDNEIRNIYGPWTYRKWAANFGL